MRIGLLGELEVTEDSGGPITITGAKLRALLAILALNAGRPVAADHLVEALWGEDPPVAVRNGLQGLVSKLRRALGSPALVGMRSGGYALEVDPDAVDANRFESMVSDARNNAASDPERAVGLLAEADGLWRGDALAEFVYEDFASAAISRLTELRLSAIEDRVDLDLQLGHHHTVIAELEALVKANPLRERPRALLMLALYRSGRQADALRAYQEGREILADELGLDPGPELRQMEQAILMHDASVDPPAAVTTDAVTSARSTIPESLTPLVGRDQELRELATLLDGTRLLTLVGPGGVGKTRLALSLARSASSSLAAGGCLVELAPVGDPAGVPAAIAAALGLPDSSRLAEVIGARELLIVLDNCEHVIADASRVAEDLLRRCPALRVVATSREALRVDGEVIWPVPPLAADDAVELFLARARAAGARLELSDDLVAAIADICARLDGLPLAIELAAARTRAFPIPQISTRLEDRFRLLTGGSRTALPRQQTLRAVVDWSYELLFEDEQRVFERLSVFPGGCDLATAEVVCGDETLAAGDIADIVYALVDKSLVIATPSGDETRFSQLQTLAHYARQKLAERGDAERVRGAMTEHYAALCRQSTQAYSGDLQRSWLMKVAVEQDNLRGALEWAIASGDAERALTIAGGVSWRHWLAGMIVEGKRWLDDAFACEGEVSDLTRGVALTGRGLLAFQMGETQQVDADLETALDIFRAHDDVDAMTLAYSFYAEVAAARGDTDEARRRRSEVLEFYNRRPDDHFVVAARAYSRAKLGVLDGDLAEAEARYRESADGFARVDRPMMRSMCLGMVADFDERVGDYEGAADVLEEAIDINDALGLQGFMGALLARLGWVSLHRNDLARAERTYGRALELGRRLSHTSVIFLSLAGLAEVHRQRGRNGDAEHAAVDALDIYLANHPRRFGNRIDPEADIRVGAATCCTVLSVLACEAGDASRAASLLGAAQQLRAGARSDVPPFQGDTVEDVESSARRALGPEAYGDAFAVGLRGRLGDDVVVRA